ncbi:PR-1-like protein [Lentithecium fluviatile CBS 122367]|uniref:PR-1-like protein n=1 Tax=Lentithecium fluviatile CBS 122367 TaxID=1168545 RepID=A0A6G1J961_9PLEO|nr:PR-1-like protein [Lentithecium fluviatile CBS 122367]
MKLATFLTLAAANIAVAAPTNEIQARGSREDPELPHIEDNDFISTVLDAHWYWRRVHCAQDLQWDPALALEAFKSVNACTEKVQHDRAGSNLSGVSPSPENREIWLNFARTAIHGWHEEETKYPYGSAGYEDTWGHFTQMVWRDSSRLGCALSKCDDFTKKFPGRIYCFYENVGNNIAPGEFEKNVWPPVCSDPTGRVAEQHYGK